MSSLNTSSGTNLLRILYPNGLEELWFKESPFVAWVPKGTDGGGLNRQISPIINGIVGSNTFATALANASTPTFPKFNVDYVSTYVVGSIDNLAAMRSKGDKKALREMLKTQLDAAAYTFSRAAAHQVWNNGGGSLGRLPATSAISGSTITLLNASDGVNFEVGYRIVGSDTDGTSGAIHAAPNLGTISGIARGSASTIITLDTALATAMPNLAVNDYLFREGDFGNSLDGVLSWIPITNPSATLFKGVDRTADIERLSGSRYSGSGPLEKQVFDAMAYGENNGGRFDTLWLNPLRAAQLRSNVQSKAWYAMERTSVSAKKMNGDDAKFGVSGFAIAGDNGAVVVMADRNCPYAYGLLTKRDSWKLESVGEAPHFAQQSGDKFLVEAANDAMQFRMKAYWQLLNMRPIDSTLITWG